MTTPPKARRVRPDMPHYGVMPDQLNGMLNWDWVDRRLHNARNYWVCTAREDGRPHSAPVWGAWIDNALYFGTDANSVKARNIARDNRVVIHLDSGDETVILEGALVDAQASEALQKRIGDRYVEKYTLDPQLNESDALLFRLMPRKVLAWLESDYPATATCWLFEV